MTLIISGAEQIIIPIKITNPIKITIILHTKLCMCKMIYVQGYSYSSVYNSKRMETVQVSQLGKYIKKKKKKKKDTKRPLQGLPKQNITDWVTETKLIYFLTILEARNPNLLAGLFFLRPLSDL